MTHAPQGETVGQRIQRLEHEIQTLKEEHARGVTTQAVRLVDEQGREHATLRADQHGPVIVLNDASGAARMRLALGHAGPGITLADERGHTRAWLGFTNEALRIGFADDLGNSRAFFGVMRSGEPVARFYDSQGNLAWSAQ